MHQRAAKPRPAGVFEKGLSRSDANRPSDVDDDSETVKRLEPAAAACRGPLWNPRVAAPPPCMKNFFRPWPPETSQLPPFITKPNLRQTVIA